MKNVLTVKGPGCVALGHPAGRCTLKSAAIASQRMMTGARRTPLLKPLRRHRSDKVWRGGTRNKPAMPIPAGMRTTGASRVMRRSAARTGRRRMIAPVLSAQEPAVAPRAAVSPCGLEFMVEVHFTVRLGWRSGACSAPARWPINAARARDFQSVHLHRQQGRAQSAPADAAWIRRHAGPREIFKWPTKCSSTPPIRKRPGSWCYAATVSRNSISNPRNASS